MDAFDFPISEARIEPATSSPKRSRWKRLWLIFALIWLTGGSFELWRWWQKQDVVPVAQAQQPSMPVQTLTVQAVSLAETTEFVASLRSHQSVLLRPQVQGQVAQIRVRPGDRVTAGTVLIEINPQQQQALVSGAAAAAESAQASIANARAGLQALEAQRVAKLTEVQYAQQEYDRFATLAEAGAVSRQMRDQYAQQLEVARALLNAMDEQIRAQQATVAQAEQSWQAAQAQTQAQESQLAYFQITAPFTGVVGDIPVKVGEVVSPGTALIGLAKNDSLEVNFSVPAERAALLQPGSPVELVDSQGQTLGTSQVSFIAPNADPATQLVLVKALLPNPKGNLRADQFVQARITWSQRQGTRVPASAVTHLGSESFVFVTEPGPEGTVARQRSVQLGEIEDSQYQVIEGLRPSEAVITIGVLMLRDGAPVSPIEN
ncbi:efflux RND transporter periplasmic adaptor subunit [Leptolyngbya sp. CCNP1308]|uniref:efflux RND transporter periplasmic adaptor subunit n=1 Tax=Leptolyngbya sp. CCNP1308 TaxID=3110255 RepID=UPI002B1FFF9B|nr:efflux RND transporter periplasmic adaptor subunit [Leptolyngbya sp. CCNP1308]MEA5449241.1 efflux RND transporter periplasmic adaptor subunit [Leptolyngbya sp. CCNP1308]